MLSFTNLQTISDLLTMVIPPKDRPRKPIIIGADIELANALIERWGLSRPAHQAACALLTEIPGYPRNAHGGSSIEYGRRFFENDGGSAYIDSDHLEINFPEHIRAADHPKILHAGLRRARMAQIAANELLDDGSYINLIANCSDGMTSWGPHLNASIARQCFDELIGHRPHLAIFLATHLVTSVIYTGQGLVGPANNRPYCHFQLSQRADWFCQLFGQQTMFDRPLINTRDESHAGPELARLHIIYYDMVLTGTANILKAGTTQLIVAMIEAGWVDLRFCLDDPVAAASQVSRDLGLRQRLPTVGRGQPLTAVEIQAALAELAGEFVAEGMAEGIVPDAEWIVELWLEMIELLQRREFQQLARHTDCWLKFWLLQRHRSRKNLSWASGDLKILDSMFASLDPKNSLFFQVADAGGIENMPRELDITNSLSQPPCDTRAYFRAHLLRRYGDSVYSINWDNIVFRMPSSRYWWSLGTIRMPDPTSFNRDETEYLFQQCGSLEEVVESANAMIFDPIDDATTSSSNHRGQNRST